MLIINIRLCLDIDTYTLCAIGNRSNESDHTLDDMWWEIKIWRAIETTATATAIVREELQFINSETNINKHKISIQCVYLVKWIDFYFLVLFRSLKRYFSRLCKRIWVCFNWCSWRRRRRQRQSTKIDWVNDEKKHKTKRFIQSANGAMNCANIQ